MVVGLNGHRSEQLPRSYGNIKTYCNPILAIIRARAAGTSATLGSRRLQETPKAYSYIYIYICIYDLFSGICNYICMYSCIYIHNLHVKACICK